jgi:hypothetical protein
MPGTRKRVRERMGDRMLRVGEDRVGQVLTQLAREVPLAQPVLGVAAEDAMDSACHRVVGVADDHFGRTVQRTEERFPRRPVSVWERLKAPQRRRGRPFAGLTLLTAHRGKHMKPTARTRTGDNTKVLAVDEQPRRPALRQLPLAHQASEHINPVRHQLSVPHRIAPTPPTARALARRGDPRSLAPGSRCRGLVAGALSDSDKRVADLARREAILTRAGLSLPRLQRRGALNAISMRIALPCQDRREAMLPVPIRRRTPPPLATMRSLSIPPIPHHPATSMLNDRTNRNLHNPKLPASADAISTQIE